MICLHGYLPHRVFTKRSGRERRAACLEGVQQAEADLDAAALAVRHAVHAPVGVNVEHLQQPRPPRWVHARHAVDHAPRREVPLAPKQLCSLAVGMSMGLCRSTLVTLSIMRRTGNSTWRPRRLASEVDGLVGVTARHAVDHAPRQEVTLAPRQTLRSHSVGRFTASFNCSASAKGIRSNVALSIMCRAGMAHRRPGRMAVAMG